MVVLSSLDNRNTSDDPWIVFGYEIQMYFETRNLLKYLKNKDPNNLINLITRNATVESELLHTRIMIEILISQGSETDDITLKDLMPEWHSTENAKLLTGKLKDIYGKRNEKDSPRWILNKMLAHPTKWRTDRFDYGQVMRKIEPVVIEILSEIEKIAERPVLTYYITSTKQN
jgi:hypothetical protein